jgi:hypothetical protein
MPHSFPNLVLVYRKLFLSFGHEFRKRKAHVPLVCCPVEQMQYSCLRPLHRMSPNPYFTSNAVCSMKTDAIYLIGQAVGITAQHICSLSAVMPVDPRRQCWPRSQALQENHDILHSSVSCYCVCEALAPLRPQAWHLSEKLGGLTDHLQSIQTKPSDQSLGQCRTNTFDEMRAEITLQSL